LNGGTSGREQQLVFLPYRGDPALRWPNPFFSGFGSDRHTLLETLVGPHMVPTVEIAVLGIPGADQWRIFLPFFNCLSPRFHDFDHGAGFELINAQLKKRADFARLQRLHKRGRQ